MNAIVIGSMCNPDARRKCAHRKPADNAASALPILEEVQQKIYYQFHTGNKDIDYLQAAYRDPVIRRKPCSWEIQRVIRNGRLREISALKSEINRLREELRRHRGGGAAA